MVFDPRGGRRLLTRSAVIILALVLPPAPAHAQTSVPPSVRAGRVTAPLRPTVASTPTTRVVACRAGNL